MDGEYEYNVFRIVRAKELSSYRPERRVYHAAYRELKEAFGSLDYVRQLLEFHFQAENDHFQRTGAEDDPCFIKAQEVFRGLTAAPLMAEIPEKEAYILWSIAGSWPGALILAGLDPPDENRRRQMAKRYAIANASISLLPDKLRVEIPINCLDLAENLCKRARTTGKVIKTMDIPDKYRKTFNEAGIDLYDVMYQIGIPVKISKKTLKKMADKGQKIPGANFKAHAMGGGI